MKCTNCGCEISEVMSFCTNCGLKLENNPVNVDSENENINPAENTVPEKKITFPKKTIKLNSKQKKILISFVVIILALALTGTGAFVLIERNNFAGCFETVKTKIGTETIDSVAYSFKVENKVLRNNIVFGVKAGEKEFTCSPGLWESKEGSIDVVIKPPEDGKSYADSIEVECYAMSGDNKLWSETKTIPFNTKDVFVHKGKILYHNVAKEVEITDHKETVINLTELFDDFDPKKNHRADMGGVHNGGADFEIRKDPNVPLGNTNRNIQSGIYLVAKAGKDNAENGFECYVSDKKAATEVNWDNYVKAYAWGSGYMGEIMAKYTDYTELDISVENACDEDIYVSLTKFYVNNVPSNEDVILYDLEHPMHPGDKKEDFYVWFTIPQIFDTDNSGLHYLGAEVVIKDEDDNVIYRKVRNYDVGTSGPAN